MNIKTRYILIFFVIFGLVYGFRLKAKLKPDLKEGQPIIINGCLSQEPTIKDNIQQFKIKDIFIKTSAFPNFNYGDCLNISGTLKKKVIKRGFDQFWLINPEIKTIKSYSQNFSFSRRFFASLLVFRTHSILLLKKLLPFREAALLSGIVLGFKESLDSSFYQALKNTGTLHIVVASGMNISLTAGLLLEFFTRFLKRKIALIVSLICILIYCMIAGFQPPIIRAGIMASLLYLSQFLGREADSFWFLILTGGIMLLANPFLVTDVGFQLSLSATAGLIILAPKLEKFFSSVKILSFLRGEVSQTLAAQIFTLPILLITFGNFNPFSLLPNLLVLWLIPYLMMLGFLIIFWGEKFFFLAQFLAWLAFIGLNYMVKTIMFFGQFEFLNVGVPVFSWFFAVGYYLVLASFLTQKTKN